ncbi:MAG: NAD(P)-binding domain-containing protein [bacterium]
MTETIGFLGTGRIAEPMIRSLARRFPDYKIFVSDRSSKIAAEVSKLNNVTIASNQGVLDQSGTVFICLLAKVAREILPELKFNESQSVVTVMADIALDEVSKLIAPASRPCVTIPLPFIEQGECPLPVYPSCPELEILFEEENEVITLSSEDAIAPHFAATAILSTTMKQLDTVSDWLGRYCGDSRNAEKYVAILVSGYLGAMPKDGTQRFKQAMDDLSTEGGLNNQLRQRITDSGFFDELTTGLDELHQRLTRNSG